MGEHISRDWTRQKKPAIGRELRSRREARNWSNSDLAKAVVWVYVLANNGIPPNKSGKVLTEARLRNSLSNAISNIEAGKVGIGRLYRDAFRVALETPDSALVELEERYEAVVNRGIQNLNPMTKDLLSLVEFEVFETSIGWEGVFYMGATATKVMKAPPGFAGRGKDEIFGFIMSGSSMEPRYFHKEVIWIDRKKTVRIGDFVLVCPPNEKFDLRRMVRQILGFNQESWRLLQLNPREEREYSRTEWPLLLPISGASDNPDIVRNGLIALN